MKFKEIISFFLMFSIVFAPMFFINETHSILTNNGKQNYPVLNPGVNVGNLQDSSYTYTGADIVVYELGIHPDKYVTVVVIDDGLFSRDWIELEQNPEANVDVIGFLTKTETGVIEFIDDPNNPYLEGQVWHSHGFATTSVVGTIARGVKVIFVDMQMGGFLGSDPYGFYEGDIELWQWLDDNQATYDIDIITWSQTSVTDIVYYTPQIANKWNSLINKEVIMINSAGNGHNDVGTYRNFDGSDYSMYPSYYTQWYSIGSIDHDTIYGQSVKHQRSEFSSWYESSETGNHILNWLEPGNGIPALFWGFDGFGQRIGVWKYHCGTSYSTPYLAGVIALIITGYHNGIGSFIDPTVQKIVDILQYASSRSTFDQKMGYGYIDVYMAYGRAFTEGRLA